MNHTKNFLKGKKILYRKEFLDVSKNYPHYHNNANIDFEKTAITLSNPQLYASNYVPKTYYKSS
jgi:hypothetical protein